MKHSTTIRSELGDFIKRHETTIQAFSQISGVNGGTLSAILSGSRPIAVSQLDRITAAMGLPEGEYYDLYAYEYITGLAPHWRRLRPFLLRCAELGKEGVIDRVISNLVDNLDHIPEIFDTAEILFERGHYRASAILYECVTECEKYCHSERLAISQFRLFEIGRKEKPALTDPLIQFLPYRNRLPEAYALDGLLLLAEAFYEFGRWKDVITYARELFALVDAIYQAKYDVLQLDSYTMKHPLVYYYGQACLLESASYEQLMEYDKALERIDGYENLEWCTKMDAAGHQAVHDFRRYAQVNRLKIEVKKGNRTVIKEYAALLKEHPQEALEGLITLLTSALHYQYSIDDVLQQFQDVINHLKSSPYTCDTRSHGAYTPNRCPLFFYSFAVYCFQKERNSQGIDNIVHGLEASLLLRDKEMMIQCMALFELYRQYANRGQQEQLLESCNKMIACDKQDSLTFNGAGYR